MSRHRTLPEDPDERDRDLELKAIREEFREPLKRTFRPSAKPEPPRPARRVALRLPVEFVREDGTAGRGEIENISCSGALILGSARPSFVVGERLLLYLSFFPGTTLTSLRSRVVRLHPRGIGVTFEQFDERTSALLHQLLPRLSWQARPDER